MTRADDSCGPRSRSGVPVGRSSPGPVVGAGLRAARVPAARRGPWKLQTCEAKIRVVVVARGLPQRRFMEFLPHGDLPLSDRSGRLPIVSDRMPEPIPGISPARLASFTGSDFPAWTPSAFTGADRVRRMPGTRPFAATLHDERGNERHREAPRPEVGQRIRDIGMGPGAKLHPLDKEGDGTVPRTEPAQ